MKKSALSTLLFGIFFVLLLIPQTRVPIQVAVNKLRIFVWSPSALGQEGQIQLKPFTYQLEDLKGFPKTMDIGKGQVTFLSYWATWCPPCIAELPSIAELHSDYGDQINFVLITSESPEVISRFLEKKGYQLPVFRPRMKTPELLFNPGIPTNYIIDKKGRIVVKETGAADWNSKTVRMNLDRLVD